MFKEIFDKNLPSYNIFNFSILIGCNIGIQQFYENRNRFKSF